jgi:hypothetical protein
MIVEHDPPFAPAPVHSLRSGRQPIKVRIFDFIQRSPLPIITTALRNKLTETVYHISRREIVLSRFSLGSSVTDTSPLEHFDRVFRNEEVLNAQVTTITVALKRKACKPFHHSGRPAA